MSFESPLLLLFLLAVPAAVAAYVAIERRRAARAAAWSTPALLPNMVDRPSSWRRHLPVALLLAGLTLLLVGFARPRATVTEPRREATIVLVLDESGSMAAKDVAPSRLAAARAVADRFVAQLPHGYQLGVVVFSDHSAVVASPTGDTARLRNVLAATRTGLEGTALDAAVAHALDATRAVPRTNQGKVPPAVLVVLSDGGANETDGVTVQQAVAKANKDGVPVDTVAIGTANGIVSQALQGGLTEQIQVPVEPAPLQTLSKGTGGRAFATPSAVDVATIYRHLASRAGHKRTAVEVTSAAVGGALAFMVAGAALSGLWFRRLL